MEEAIPETLGNTVPNWTRTKLDQCSYCYEHLGTANGKIVLASNSTMLIGDENGFTRSSTTKINRPYIDHFGTIWDIDYGSNPYIKSYKEGDDEWNYITFHESNTGSRIYPTRIIDDEDGNLLCYSQYGKLYRSTTSNSSDKKVYFEEIYMNSSINALFKVGKDIWIMSENSYFDYNAYSTVYEHDYYKWDGSEFSVVSLDSDFKKEKLTFYGNSDDTFAFEPGYGYLYAVNNGNFSKLNQGREFATNSVIYVDSRSNVWLLDNSSVQCYENGQWQDYSRETECSYSSYTVSKSITECNGKIYIATQNGLYTYTFPND